jgi:hypothetical protein
VPKSARVGAFLREFLREITLVVGGPLVATILIVQTDLSLERYAEVVGLVIIASAWLIATYRIWERATRHRPVGEHGDAMGVGMQVAVVAILFVAGFAAKNLAIRLLLPSPILAVDCEAHRPIRYDFAYWTPTSPEGTFEPGYETIRPNRAMDSFATCRVTNYEAYPLFNFWINMAYHSGSVSQRVDEAKDMSNGRIIVPRISGNSTIILQVLNSSRSLLYLIAPKVQCTYQRRSGESFMPCTLPSDYSGMLGPSMMTQAAVPLFPLHPDRVL